MCLPIVSIFSGELLVPASYWQLCEANPILSLCCQPNDLTDVRVPIQFIPCMLDSYPNSRWRRIPRFKILSLELSSHNFVFDEQIVNNSKRQLWDQRLVGRA